MAWVQELAAVGFAADAPLMLCHGCWSSEHAPRISVLSSLQDMQSDSDLLSPGSYCVTAVPPVSWC